MSSPSAYDMFYGGAEEDTLPRLFKGVMPGFINDAKDFVVRSAGLTGGALWKSAVRFLLCVVLILLFLWLLSNSRPLVDFVLRTYRAGMARLGLRGFEGMGAMGTDGVRFTHLGELTGQPEAQRQMQMDRFSAGGEAPVFWDAPSYVQRKDELVNNAMGDYNREKASGVTSLSFNDWFNLNSARYGTFGESGSSLSLSRDSEQQMAYGQRSAFAENPFRLPSFASFEGAQSRAPVFPRKRGLGGAQGLY